MATFTPVLGPDAVAAVDSTAQAARMLELGDHVRDALLRVGTAALPRVDAPGGLVVAGMGGSAIGGRLAVAALGERARRPVVVTDGYELPPWVGPGVLVLCSSYSGGTEEVLACYEEAMARRATVVTATAGGALAERARRDAVSIITLPGGFQPRAAVGYSLVCALEVAAAAGVGPALRGELEAAARLVDELAAEWAPEGPADSEPKRLALRLDGTVPVITGAGLTAAVAYRWKCQCNENAKIPAFCSALPEADHNEICGWATAARFGEFSALFLQDRADRAEHHRRSELSSRLAAAGARVVERVASHGTTRLERLLSLVLLGDLVSLYLAVLRGADPVEIEAIAQLKTALETR